MELKRVIQYSDIYPETEGNLPDAQSFIKGLRREDLCIITANMMTRLNGMPFFDATLDPRKNEYDFVRFFLSDRDPVFTQDVINRHAAALKRLPENFKGGFVATSKAAIMSFQRLFFSVVPETNQDRSTQIEKDFSRALLRVNEDVYEAEYNGEKHLTEPLNLRLAHLYLAYNYANEDVESSDINDAFRRQLTKSITLFSFLFRSKDKRIKKLRARFLAHFHIGNWVEYIIPHIMTIHFVKEKSGLLKIKGDHKHGRKARRVIEKSCVEKDDLIPVDANPDYMVFRGKPYIRMKKHHYAITNMTFVVEHIFNSVYFELKGFRKDAGFISDDEFRQYYTTEFSQKFMFEGYVKQCLPSNMLKSFSGSQCDEILENAKKNGVNTDCIVPPDYYLRVPEGCIVFEYKDSLTNAKVKESRDAEKLFADIKKKFFENDRGSHKGVTQLLDSAKAIQEGSFLFDNPETDSAIYPVLVVDNPVYSMRGMHTVLEYMMRDECQRRGMRSHTIKPLILMDVATLKLYSDYFNFLWESEYDYSKQDTLSYLKPSRQLFESMGMMYSDTDGELLDADGNLLCFDACANHNCHEYLLVRKDAFVRYLQSNHKKIVWALIGEKNLMGSMIPHGEWLDISGTYCLDSDNEVKGSMATYLEGKPLNRWAME